MNQKTTMRVLLLDDDEFMLNLVKRILHRDGWTEVTACATGQAALLELENAAGVPDLILCDLNMPEMDGIEFIRALFERHYAGALILLSGVDARLLQTAQQLVQAHHIRLLGVLGKPIVAAELLALMGSAGSAPAAASERPAKAYTAEALELAIKDGQLVNYYQPKVHIRTGALVGFETLVRWRHPIDGMVGPDLFIGVAEDSGLIHVLTDLVLRQSIEQLQLWRTAGMDVRIAVNVSMNNLTTLTFPDMVGKHLRASQQLAQHLTLEITESRLMRDDRTTLDILARLRLKGVWLSIDDFGTGHSSFDQLYKLPFNQLKIDKAYVHHAWQDPTTRAIYDASLGLAHQLRIESVGEGVEDIDDWRFLRETGCDVAQGYFVARPMPAAEVPAWLAQWLVRAPGLCV